MILMRLTEKFEKCLSVESDFIEEVTDPFVVLTDMKNYRDWDPKHNICAFLDENSKYSLNFRDIIRFLNRSRIKVAITIKTVPYISQISSFWENAEVDYTQEPPVRQSLSRRRLLGKLLKSGMNTTSRSY